MRLYEFAPTRSIRARWMLQELGIDFEAVSVSLPTGAHRSAEFLEINPAGKVPALVDGDLIADRVRRYRSLPGGEVSRARLRAHRAA